MKIALDISPISQSRGLDHRVRGTGFYVENLKYSLLKYYPDNTYSFFTKTSEIPPGIELIHFPYFEPFFLSLHPRSDSKTVVTVHDLTPIVFPKFCPRGIRGEVKWQIQKKRLRNSDIILADSECSKKDIVEYTKVPLSRVRCVYLAAAKEFGEIRDAAVIAAIRKKYNLADKFILYVGDVTWNKNLPRLVRAVTKLQIPLVMVGKALIEKDFDHSNPWNQDRLTVEKLAKSNPFIVRLGFLPLPDLIAIYNSSTVFVMPSLYEGFGLPALEAMQCGVPVIVSKKGSLPEIAGKAGYYVDAENEDDIASGIQSVFGNKALQQKLRDLGREQAKLFSWEKTCRETVQAYEDAVSNV